jgi:hypothetical protein|tara:strand:+ start:877 stop:1230 length:354 start_codon:yes stop_codon:yes gene_type:complete
LSDKKKTKTEEVKEVEEKAQEVQVQDETQPPPQQPKQVNPREVLLQVFEQGARASDNWDRSQLRIQCLLALQQVPNLADIPNELRVEINFVVNELLKAGQLNFGLQQVLYPLVKELE